MVKIVFAFWLVLGMGYYAHACGAATLALATEDTAVRIKAEPSQFALASLQCRQTGREWIDPLQGPQAIPLIAAVEVDGRSIPCVWTLIGTHRENGAVPRCVLTYVARELKLELRSEWTARPGPGPVEHTLSITSHNTQPLLLPLQTTLRFDSRSPDGHTLEHWWVEKGAGAPTDAGTHHDLITPGFARSLVSTPYSEDNKARDAIPWAALQDRDGKNGWYAGIEFSGRVRQALKGLPATRDKGVGVSADFGLAPEEGNASAYRTQLLPGATFQAPTVFVGCYAGDVEDGANRLRRWVGTALRPAAPDPRYPLLVLNSWGSGMAVDKGLASSMIDDGAALGLEMFHIDAGWFRGVGDWRADPAKFPDGLAPIADHAHARGLLFGLWVGWTQGGVRPDVEDRQAVLNVFAPDRKNWFAYDHAADWKPADFTGADLCLADPDADAWCISLLDRLVTEYKLDMLEHDQRMIVDACNRTDHPHTASATDIAYHAARGYYRVYDAVRARHPRLLFEDCVNGGRTVDYGIVRRVHYISITDTYNPLANRRAFYDASYALPPAMCECYIENEAVKTPEEFRTLLRSGMMGWCTIMCDTTHWTPEQHSIALRQFALYKTRLRPLIKNGNLYHVSERPDGVRWDGIQYADPQGKQAVLYAFRGSTSEPQHLFLLRGLTLGAQYNVTFEDGGAPAITRSGKELMTKGIEVALDQPGSSQLVFMTKVPSPP